MTTLQFSPFASTILPEFWTSLSKLKIDELKLSEHPIPLKGSYGPGRSVIDRNTGQQLGLGTPITFDAISFESSKVEAAVPVASTSWVRTCMASCWFRHSLCSFLALSRTAPQALQCTIHGTIINFNTIEAFKNSDKQALFHEAAQVVRPSLSLTDLRLPAHWTRADWLSVVLNSNVTGCIDLL